MDTRTAPRSSGGRSQAIDEPVISSVKVPSDPAQVIVNHVSFRVKLARPSRPQGRSVSVMHETAPLPIIPSSVRSSSGEYTRLGGAATGTSPDGPAASGRESARWSPGPGGPGDGGPGSGRAAGAPRDAGPYRRTDPQRQAGPYPGADRDGRYREERQAGPYPGDPYRSEGPYGADGRNAAAGPRSADGPPLTGGHRGAEGDRPADPGDMTPPTRRAPVMWSGRAGPDDAAATQLLRAVQEGRAPVVPPLNDDDGSAFGTAATGTRMDLGLLTEPGALPARRPAVIGPRRPSGEPMTGPDVPGRPFASGNEEFDDYADHDEYPHAGSAGDGTDEGYDEGAATGARGFRAAARARAARRAYHPGRGRNPGLVLLPLRIFLGGISVYAGMSKLCDPVFFDGGERGSMVQWLSSLKPWTVAAPLHDLALGHPVGAGLTVAFIQIVVGMLTVLGLWQRFAAGLGMLLSAALLVTVSWRTAPAYDVPDIIYLAAWSPLLIAGAPAYSLDGRLANDAWRTLGPRSSLFDLRRLVLRRGMVVATVVVGLTLIVGSVLGGAVRAGSFRTDVPNPSEPPVNHLPGEPLPSRPEKEPDQRRRSERPESRSPAPKPSAPEQRRTTTPVPQRPSQGGTVGGTGAVPGQGSTGTAPQQPRQQPPPSEPDPPRQQPPAPSDSGSGGGGGGDGALGGILGADGLLGMSGEVPDPYTSA